MHASDKMSNGQQPGTSDCLGNSSRKQPLIPLENRIGSDFSQSGPSSATQENSQSSHDTNCSGEGVRSSLHGIIYQLKLSILFLQTALDENYSFELYSEKKDAEKFDDVVFKYGRDGEYRFLQAKHTMKPENDKITVGKLLSENSKEPFNLQKYFISFRRIKQKYKEKIKDLIICTNAGFSEDIKEDLERGCGWLTYKDKSDDILDIGGGKLYEFIFDENKLVERLKDASDLNRLARELVKVVFDGKRSLTLTNKLLKTYHVPLVKEVFDIKSVPADGNVRLYCEFKENFTKGNNLSQEAELLREAFKKKALKMVKSIDSNSLWNNSLWDIVCKKKLYVSPSFGRHTKSTDKKSKHVSDVEINQSLPNDPVTDNEIKEFFRKLIFAVEQPNEERLGELIQEKIFNSLDHLKDYGQAEIIYDHVQKKMLDWLKKPRSTALLKKDNFFSEGAKKINEIMLSIPALVYSSGIKKKGINFKNEHEELQQLIGFFNSKDKKIFNFISSTKNMFLSEAKVWQVKEQEAWLLEDLLNLKKFSDSKAGNLFKDNLLVIICENESQIEYEDIKELYDELADFLKDNEKKIILITQGGGILGNFFEKGCLKNRYEKKLDKTGVGDLNPDCLQNKLLKKTVIFQGQKRNLAYLIGIKDMEPNNGGLSEEEIHKLEKVVECETLCEVISDKDIVVGDKLPDFRDPSSPYYDPYHIDVLREFDHKMMTEDSLKNCVKERKEDKFAFSAIEVDFLNNLIPQEEKGKIKAFSKRISSDEDFFKGRFFVLDAKNPEDNLKEIVKWNNNVNGVHWITNIDGNFILKHSSRLSDLCKFMKNVSRKKIKDLTDSFVIIAGAPGIGKSTVLTTCSQKLDLSSWFIRVNLKDHEMHIENAKFEDLEIIIKFFSESNVFLETELAKSLLRYRLKCQGQIVLLLDGYDEIKDRNQEKVIQLLKTIKNTKGKIWLTTRLTKSYEVENALGIFSYFLNPFDKEQQKEFLKQFWISKLIKNSDQEKENRIDDFTEKLLGHFRESGLMKEDDLVGIVLQARMVAEIFQDECKKYLKFEKFNPSEFRINNMFGLYERFIECQYDRYFTEKIKIGKDLLSKGSQIVLTESLTKAHGCLALKTLFSEDQTCKEFLKDQTQVFLQNELSCMGLIKNFKDSNVVDFIHRTYAEYFIARLLISILGKREDYPEYKLIREFFLRNILFNRYELILVFLEEGIKKKHDDDLNNKWKKIQDCDLLRKIETKESSQLFNLSSDSAIPEESLSELKGAVESYMNWRNGEYYYNSDHLNLINKLFKKFLVETNLEKLETTLEFLVKANGKSIYQPANAEFSRDNNMYIAVKHYLNQAKLQNKLNLNFVKAILLSMMKEGDIETFKLKLDELNKSAQENKEKYAEEFIKFLYEWRKGGANLLLIEFFVTNIKQNIEKLYSGKDILWLERSGFEIVKCFEILTPKMSREFCSVLDKAIKHKTISGFESIYACNILRNLIYPIIDMMKVKQLPKIHKLAFIKILASCTHFYIKQKSRLSFEFSQLEIVLKLINTLLSEQVSMHVLECANYLFILGKLGLKLIDIGQGLLILDPASEFQYVLSSSRDQIVELIDWMCKNPQDNFFKAYGEVMIKPQLRRRRTSFDESYLQALTKKRKIV